MRSKRGIAALAVTGLLTFGFSVAVATPAFAAVPSNDTIQTATRSTTGQVPPDRGRQALARGHDGFLGNWRPQRDQSGHLAGIFHARHVDCQFHRMPTTAAASPLLAPHRRADFCPDARGRGSEPAAPDREIPWRRSPRRSRTRTCAILVYPLGGQRDIGASLRHNRSATPRLVCLGASDGDEWLSVWVDSGPRAFPTSGAGDRVSTAGPAPP